MNSTIPNDPVPNDPADSTQGATTNSRGAWWRLPLLLLIVLVAIIAVRSAQQPVREVKHDEKAASPPVAADGKAVSLSIDFADGRKRDFDRVAWQPGMTVDDLLTAASRLPDGIRYRVVGDGEMTFLTGIDGIENGAAGGRFWVYRVNDKLADRSLGVYELQAGDRVLWTFSEKE